MDRYFQDRNEWSKLVWKAKDGKAGQRTNSHYHAACEVRLEHIITHFGQ